MTWHLMTFRRPQYWHLSICKKLPQKTETRSGPFGTPSAGTKFLWIDFYSEKRNVFFYILHCNSFLWQLLLPIPGKKIHLTFHWTLRWQLLPPEKIQFWVGKLTNCTDHVQQLEIHNVCAVHECFSCVWYQLKFCLWRTLLDVSHG